MRNFLSFATTLCALFCLSLPTAHSRSIESARSEKPQTATPQQAVPPATQQAPSPPQPAPPAQAAPVHAGPVIVLNPAHGGTDSGARGGTGAIEKDIVLQYAQAVRAELERDGFRVVLTRTDDSNPSYDDRAAMANTYRDVLFVSLHIASSGAAGTARAYYYRFASVPSGPVTANATSADTVPVVSAPPSGLLDWQEAQQAFVDSSHRLADTLQSQLAQQFSGSPVMATAVPIRELRSIAAPAVAVEVSSVLVTDPNSLSALASPLATAIARGLQAFRSAQSGTSQ